MAQAAKKRRGRPMLAPKKGTRVVLGLRVRPELKQQIDDAARASGRTQAQEAELLIEKGLAVDGVLALSGTTLEEFRRGAIESELRKDGYTPMRSSYGKIWLPKDYPVKGSHGGFEA
jgi:hypothetical protein